MAEAGKHARAAALIGGVGLALGLVLGLVGRELVFTDARGEDPAEARQPGPLGSSLAASPLRDSDELAAALRELNQVLASLETTLERAETRATPSARVPVDTGDPVTLDASSSSDAQLAKSLADIAAALRVLQARGGGGSSSSAVGLVAPAWVDRSSAFTSAPMKAALLADDNAGWDAAFAVFRDRHLLWSQQDVLSAYGKPDKIHVSDAGARWRYIRRIPGEGEEEFDFRFHEGVVYSVDYDYDEE